ncbi:MAG: sigma-70 RNA polymerase sigma factor region 4 domain-containing protein [Thermomicrobiales bacterium]
MDVRRIPLAELVAACRVETERFLRREPSRDAFCLEIVRRAICDRDQQAWTAVFAQYHGMVLAWVRRHPVSRSTHEDDAFWVNRTFDRFWAAIGPERFDAFPNMAALLRYLKLCAHSVLLDEMRARDAAGREPLTDQVAESIETPDVAEAALGQLAGSDLWEVIVAEMQDEAERRVAYCCFVLDLKPREVQERHPQLYATVDDVYRIKRNLLERLRRSARIRAFLA